MINFTYSIPTEIWFGKGQIKNIGSIAKKYGKKALIVYGGGSVKRNGILDDAKKYLAEAGVDCLELSGVEPNPRVTTVKKGADICKQENIDVVIPIGGGSTIDCAKVIAASAHYDGDPWDIVVDPSKITDVTPVISVLTLSATGSEMDTFAVISNIETNDKIGLGHPKMRPVASILDPTYTFTVNKFQTGAGTSDIISHILEIYFSNGEGYMQDRMAEALLKTVIHFGVIAIDEPDNYEARANLMWSSSWAINDTLTWGKPVAWTIHPMEHELSAYYDITHGAGLAILTPYWMEYVLSDKTVDKFAQYGVNVWDIDKNMDKYDIAKEAIKKTREYFNALGMPSTLHEVGIDDKLLDVMAKKASVGLEDAFVALTAEDVKKIYEMAL